MTNFLHRSFDLLLAGFRVLLFPAIVFTNFSCGKSSIEPSPSNEITLSSETFGTSPYYSMGYSFEKQEFYKRLTSGSEIDIYLNEVINPRGELLGVQFSTNTISESTYGYYLNDEFTTLSEAESCFNNYKEVDFPEYFTLSDTVKAFQVFTFRTWKSNFVKFLVKDVRVVYKDDIADFIEVDIKYFIQKDGDDIFSE